MTTPVSDSDRTETRLTNLENVQEENRERLARLAAKVDGLTTTVANLTGAVRELNRRIDCLFSLGLAPGAGIIAAILFQPLIAGGGGTLLPALAP